MTWLGRPSHRSKTEAALRPTEVNPPNARRTAPRGDASGKTPARHMTSMTRKGTATELTTSAIFQESALSTRPCLFGGALLDIGSR